MSNLKVIVTDNDVRSAGVEDILRDALKSDYERVLVIGVNNGDVYSNVSNNISMAETLGYLEILKNELFKSW